jgi:glycosidase
MRRSDGWRGVRRLGAAVASGLLLVALNAGPGAAAPSPAPASPGSGLIDLSALYHDSRDGLYRTPGGAVPAGTTVTVRLRTHHDGATSVRLLVTSGGPYQALPMADVATDIACGTPVPAGGNAVRCDLWATTITTSKPATLGYHFVVRDGTATASVSDDARGDGGPGVAATSLSNVDWVLTVYQPGFQAVPWLQGAVVYQVFPDRFVNGNPANDANPRQPRYAYPPDTTDQIVREPWGTPPPEPSTGGEYYGGDLAGVRSKLPYLHSLGVTVLYLNPIFSSASNHGYDTRDYYQIDPRFGTQADFERLVRDAATLGMHVILDGVFDHVSADSPYFDRYARQTQTAGACQSVSSPYRAWFIFAAAPNGPCAGPAGPHTMDYTGWNSIATLPVLNKQEPAVQALVYGSPDSVARHWLSLGASGWRIDTMSDPSFPAGFWQGFRSAVKAAKPDAPIIGEAWQRDQVLPLIRGDTADTITDYRSRTPLLAYLGTADARGFADDSASGLSPAILASELAGVLEDEPPAVAGTAFRLLDSHDTERVLWSLTPGATAEEKAVPANLAVGKARLRLAALMQFSLPGAPVIYYGDEVGMTGATDPENRATYPTDGGDQQLAAWYRQLATTRNAQPVLRDGDLRFLLTDAPSRSLVYARTTPGAIAITAVNPGDTDVVLDVPLSQPIDGGTTIRDGIRLHDLLGGPDVTTADGYLRITLPPLGGALLVPEPGQSLAAPAAPTGVSAVRSAGGAELDWGAPAGATAYTVWRSPVAGGGYVLAGTTATTTFTDPAAPATVVHYVVRAVDASGNVSPASADIAAPAGPLPVASARPGASPSPEPPVAIVVIGLGGLGMAMFVAILWRRSRRAGR